MLVAGGVVGAGLEYVLDAKLGRTRRALARDRTAGAARRGARRVVRRRRMLVSQGKGNLARLLHLGGRGQRHPDDVTLARKLETELFRPADVPKGQINVNVHDGVVQLRGQVPTGEMMRDLVAKASDVAGVRRVENLMHVPSGSGLREY